MGIILFVLESFALNLSERLCDALLGLGQPIESVGIKSFPAAVTNETGLQIIVGLVVACHGLSRRPQRRCSP